MKYDCENLNNCSSSSSSTSSSSTYVGGSISIEHAYAHNAYNMPSGLGCWCFNSLKKWDNPKCYSLSFGFYLDESYVTTAKDINRLVELNIAYPFIDRGNREGNTLDLKPIKTYWQYNAGYFIAIVKTQKELAEVIKEKIDDGYSLHDYAKVLNSDDKQHCLLVAIFTKPEKTE